MNGPSGLGERSARFTPDTVLRFYQLGIGDRAQVIATGIEEGVGAGVLGADAITSADQHLVEVDVEVGDGVSAKYTSTDTLLYAGSDHLGTVSNAKLIETEDGVWGKATRPLA